MKRQNNQDSIYWSDSEMRGSNNKGCKWIDYTPLKEELLSKSLVECNKMVPESTTIKPHISVIMVPPLWPSQSWDHNFHHAMRLSNWIYGKIMLGLVHIRVITEIAL